MEHGFREKKNPEVVIDYSLLADPIVKYEASTNKTDSYVSER